MAGGGGTGCEAGSGTGAMLPIQFSLDSQGEDIEGSEFQWKQDGKLLTDEANNSLPEGSPVCCQVLIHLQGFQVGVHGGCQGGGDCGGGEVVNAQSLPIKER